MAWFNFATRFTSVEPSRLREDHSELIIKRLKSNNEHQITEQVRRRDLGHERVSISERPPPIMLQGERQGQEGFRLGGWCEIVCIVHGRTVAHEREHRKNISQLFVQTRVFHLTSRIWWWRW